MLSMKYPCAKCGKGILPGKERLLEFDSESRRFIPVRDPKGDIWQFGPDCAKQILKNHGRKDWK
jgi:hypothetical protein